jgi:hypothetical protein
MNDTLRGSELVAQWRNNAELDNPAGPLFSGEYAEADIVSDPSCSGSTLGAGTPRSAGCGPCC